MACNLWHGIWSFDNSEGMLCHLVLACLETSTIPRHFVIVALIRMVRMAQRRARGTRAFRYLYTHIEFSPHAHTKFHMCTRIQVSFKTLIQDMLCGMVKTSCVEWSVLTCLSTRSTLPACLRHERQTHVRNRHTREADTRLMAEV